MTNDTFIKITNKDIYKKIQEMGKSNSIEHNQITEHLLLTNGKVKLNRWISSTALSIVIIILGFLVNHMVR